MKVSVTEEMIAHGISGAAAYCPVSQAIYRAFKNGDREPKEVRVTRSQARVLYMNGKREQYELPPHVEYNIRRFDVERVMTPFSFEISLDYRRGPNDVVSISDWEERLNRESVNEQGTVESSS